MRKMVFMPNVVPLGEQIGDDRGGSPGVHAALSVLEALVRRGPLGLTELGAEVGVAKSSLHRICAVLVQRGWALRNRDGRFELGIRAIGIGSSAAELPLVIAFRATAATLLTEFNETVCLSAVDGDDSVFVAMEETSHAVRLVTHVGSRTPAFASASGRVILADRADEIVSAQFGGRSLETPTGRRLLGVAELLRILDDVRTTGYALNEDETAEGLHTISAPIRNGRGRVIAALTICVPSSRLPLSRRDEMIRALAESSSTLSDRVAWLPAWNATRADQSYAESQSPEMMEVAR